MEISKNEHLMPTSCAAGAVLWTAAHAGLAQGMAVQAQAFVFVGPLAAASLTLSFNQNAGKEKGNIT